MNSIEMKRSESNVMMQSKKLADDFAFRAARYNNRASTLFPFSLREENDLQVSFFDYWRLKNRLNGVMLNLRIYDNHGQLLKRHTKRVDAQHNNISVRSILGAERAASIDGMVEVEFLSFENMLYPYPAVVAFYFGKDGGRGTGFSAVHSAGRVLNPNEAFVKRKSIGTNWSCRFNDSNHQPFFHLYTGPGGLDEPLTTEVSIWSPKNEKLLEKKYVTKIQYPFSSQICFLDEIFGADLHGVPENSYARVKFYSTNTYPLMIVGNYRKSDGLYEVSHSFVQNEVEDYLESPPNEGSEIVPTFISLLQPEELELELMVFPTDIEHSTQARIRAMSEWNGVLKSTNEEIRIESGANSGKAFVRKLEPNQRMVLIEALSGPKIPARINTSFRYRVRGSKSGYSTDIASGAKAWIYPSKTNYWGHGIISEDVETVLLVRNASHNKSISAPVKGTLRISMDNSESGPIDVTINAESGQALYLSKLWPEMAKDSKLRTLSWWFVAEKSFLDICWVSFSKDGRIAGEHSF